MQHGISVLIPTYQTDVRALLGQLQPLLQQAGVKFEIRVYDDASPQCAFPLAFEHAMQHGIVFKKLDRNIGRSAIRNLMATDACYDHLLFIDADSAIPDDTFIQHYLIYWSDYDAIVGGTAYEAECPSSSVVLRWKYGKYREAISADLRNRAKHSAIALNNLLIKRAVFLRHKLDEGISTYGHEDTKLGYELARAKATVHHIQNPVIHLGLEDGATYLEKVRSSVRNFYKLSTQQGIGQDTALYRTYIKCRAGWRGVLVRLVYNLLGAFIRRNLRSQAPMLFLLDFYKLNLMLRQDKATR